MAHWDKRAVWLQDVDGHGLGRHRDHLAVVDVGRGITGRERELAYHETTGRRDGMAPGHETVEADADEREAVNRRSHRVVASWNGQMHRVETGDAKPWKVRVPEQRAPAVVGEVAPQGNGIASEGVDIPARQVGLREQALGLGGASYRG